MATNQTQAERVIGQLNKHGKITRNQCLRNYISRLGAIICTLKAEGWDFRTEHEDGDYAYYVTKKPQATLFTPMAWKKLVANKISGIIKTLDYKPRKEIMKIIKGE